MAVRYIFFFNKLVLVWLLSSASDYHDLDLPNIPAVCLISGRLGRAAVWRGSQSEGGCGWNGLNMGARPGAEQRARPQDSLKTGDLWGAPEQNVAAPLWHLLHISVSTSSPG